MRAMQEEQTKELPPQVIYPPHLAIWFKFRKLNRVLLHLWIQGYVERELHPRGLDWTVKRVSQILVAGTDTTGWEDYPNALIMVVKASQN